MKLSVIVPVYNVEPYLEDCVDSLLTQTIGDFEIFLVDDGSKDRSGEIADRYAEDHPDVVRTLHIDNGGQGRARNYALPLAKGEFVGFVDSDDWIAPDMYEKLYDRAQETGADVVYCDFLERCADGREAVLPAAMQEHPLSSAGSSCNKLFRCSLIGDLRFPEGLWYEDFYFSACMLERASHTAYVPEPLYIYRRGQQSTMHNNNAAKNLDILTIMDMLEPQLCKDDFEFFAINHVLLDTINRVAAQDAPDRAAVIRKCRAWAQQKIPDLRACKSFQAETRNRRIIMYLNYHGLEKLSQLILRAKSNLK